jgi:hypothetical protein
VCAASRFIDFGHHRALGEETEERRPGGQVQYGQHVEIVFRTPGRARLHLDVQKPAQLLDLLSHFVGGVDDGQGSQETLSNVLGDPLVEDAPSHPEHRNEIARCRGPVL